MPIKNTLILSALTLVLCNAPLASAADKVSEKTRVKPAQKHDIFEAIVGDQHGLKKVYDNGDDCQFIITDSATREALYKTLSELAEGEPTRRGATSAWDIANKRGKQRHARMISVTISKDAQGQSVLTLDRRRGETGSNPNAEKRRMMRRSEMLGRAAPSPRRISSRISSGGKVVPPPAAVD